MNGLTNFEKKKNFFVGEKPVFKSIHYDKKLDAFAFEFTYDENNSDFNKNWTVYTHGERIVFDQKTKKQKIYYPSNQIKTMFSSMELEYKSERNLMDDLENIEERKTFDVGTGNKEYFWDSFYKCFKDTLQMRNSVPNSSKAEDDYLISPVMAEDGTFFDSRDQFKLGKDENGNWISKLPVDADANGAYHIALKGLYLLKNDFNLNDKGYIENH